jgi:hypothetical protein
MNRTTIVLPEELKLRAQERARRSGISLAEFIRQSLEAQLRSAAGRPQVDPLFADVPIYRGPVPADLSVDHDRYLYDESP